MSRRIVVFVAAGACGALLSLASGCAVSDAQASEAAYPPVGYTDIASGPSAPPAAAQGAPGAAGAPPSGPPSSPPPGATGYGPPSGSPTAAGEASPGPFGPPSQGAPPPGGAMGGPDDGTGYSDADPSALTDFRSTLDPYGQWVEDPTYGTAWVPSSSVVGPDFAPYVSGGHWAYDDDYVWVSDYDWGWAPFHYGRWVYAGPTGWEWIPGRAYAGAWVTWRYGAGDWGYVGWAPLGPTWCWRRGLPVGVGFVPRAPYSFVGAHELFGPGLGGRLVTGSQVGVVGSHTQPYVPASPRVGNTAASVRMAAGGPPLSALHVSQAEVVRASAATNRGLAQAQGFARPSTAVALGARAPQVTAPHSAATFPSTHLTGAIGRSGGSMAASSVPAYAPSPSHFGGRLGAGFTGSAASAPAPSYSGSAYYGAPRMGGPSYSSRPSAGSYGGAYRGYSSPSGGYSAGAAAAVRSGGSYGGGFSGPSSSGGFHGGGSHGGGGGRGGGHR
jgi:hypothetical protein